TALPGVNFLGKGPAPRDGDLPVWMASEGLEMLRHGDYPGAAEYYQNEARRDPSRAEGWLGIGAALMGSGDFSSAITYLLKGVEIDERFPVGVLLAETKTGKPQVLLNVSHLLSKGQDRAQFLLAINILDEVMRDPNTPENLYLQANELRGSVRELLRAGPGANLTKLRARRKLNQGRRLLDGPLRLVLKVALLVALLAGGYQAWRWGQGTWLVRQGLSDYKEAAQMASMGTTSLNSSKDAADACELYFRAFTRFKRAQTYRDPSSIATLYLTIRAGESMLERARSVPSEARRLPPGAMADVESTVRQSRVRLARIDANGTQTRQQQAELNAMLDNK
ncbi:MAG: hypothetical protein EB084_21645, partial [Proteobacteria bacterium]|nr:hypothetical protein [Pseudomonadota bacterium]